MKHFKVFVLAVGILTVSIPLVAHHGTAAFDLEKKLTMKATVVDWHWINPHCILKFDVKDENGEVAHWVTETSNPSDMTNVGWAKDTLKPGDAITVTVYPVKNGKPIGRVVTIMLPDGRTLGNGFGSVNAP